MTQRARWKLIHPNSFCYVSMLAMGLLAAGDANATPPPNQTCATAVVIPSLPFSDSNVAWGQSSGAGGQCFGSTFPGNAIWYRFDATFSGSVLVVAAGGWIQTWTGTGCSSLSGVAFPFARPESVIFETQAGNAYWIQIFSCRDFFQGPLPQYAIINIELRRYETPANDVCTNATVIASLPFSDRFFSSLATDDADVSCNAPGDSTTRSGVWYRFTPAHDMLARVSASDGAVIAAFTISGPNCIGRTEIGCATGALWKNLSAGVQYWFLVGWADSAVLVPFEQTVSMQEFPALTNDTCETAVAIPGPPFNLDVSWGAAAPDVSMSCTGGSAPTSNGIWFRYLAPADAVVRLSAADRNTSSSNEIALSAFVGDSCSMLTERRCRVDSEQAALNVSVSAGETCFFLVGRPSATSLSCTTVGVSMDLLPPLTNDACASATEVATFPFTGVASWGVANADLALPCSTNSSQPTPFGVWYTFLAPADGVAEFQITSPTVWITHGLFAGPDCDHLSLVDCGSDFIPVEQGTRYWLLVGRNEPASYGAPGELTTRIEMYPPLTNDTCATAKTISALPFSDYVAWSIATPDPDVSCNEPSSQETTYGVWYTWQATADGIGQVTISNAFNSVVTVYSGSACGNLTPVSCVRGGQAYFQAASGTRYWILLGTYYPWIPGSVAHLTLETVPTPTNTTCAAAISIPEGVHVVANPFAPTTGSSSCGGSGTVWYRYLTAQPVTATIVVKPTGDSDARVGVFDGCDGSELGCGYFPKFNENAGGAYPAGTDHSLGIMGFSATPGHEYLIRVASATAGQWGSFSLRLTSWPTTPLQPRNRGACAGSRVELDFGDDNATYQWYKNGAVIPSATSQSYVIPAVASTDAGEYERVATTATTHISRSANLAVRAPFAALELVRVWSAQVGGAPVSLTTVRLNRDPRDDLCVLDYSSASVRSYLSGTNGEPILAQSISVGSNPLAIAAYPSGGVPGNDIVVAGDAGAERMRAVDSAIYRTTELLALTGERASVTLADVNRGGVVDIVSASQISMAGFATIDSRLGDGSGSSNNGTYYPQPFGPPFSLSGDVPSVATAPVLNSIDPSGGGPLQDLVLARTLSNSIEIRQNLGHIPPSCSCLQTTPVCGPCGLFSGFASSGSAVMVGQTPVSVVAAELNASGLADIAVANRDSNSVSILLNQGGGNFQRTDLAVGFAPLQVIAVDLDGDNDLDLATANRDSHSISVLLNNGAGLFLATNELALPPGSVPAALTAGDFDGDGFQDIAVACYGTSSVSIFLNSPAIPITDCNRNGSADALDISSGSSHDCNANATPDDCELAGWEPHFAEADRWSAFDPGANGVGVDPDGYQFAVFDGKYLYFVPLDNGTNYHAEVLRYDTDSPFDSASSWTAYDPSSHGVGVRPRGYEGAAFDGRYIYFAPFRNDLFVHHGEVLRFDTTKSFTSAASWTSYNPGANGVGSNPVGFQGAVFDGRFVYFVPTYNGADYHGEVLRYDSQAAFNLPGSWATFDAGAHGVGNDADGFLGAVFDGRYIYFVPFHNGTDWSGEVLRFDTTGTFSQAASWTTFDPGAAGVGTDPDGFVGAVFDGRYVYFVPFQNSNSSYSGEVLRYDTAAAFGVASSWQTFDAKASSLGATASGFAGGIFDGRYVYFVPFLNGTGYHGNVLRYDALRSFGSVASWERFDVGSDGIGTNAPGYFGAAFDGRYVYLVPNRANTGYHGEFMRFSARADLPRDCDSNGTPDECDTPQLVATFVDVLLGRNQDPVQRCLADLDRNGRVDGTDVSAFVRRLIGS